MGGAGGGGGGGVDKDLQAEINDQKLYLKDYEKDFKETLGNLRTEFEKEPDHNAFIEAADAALAKFRELSAVTNATIDSLDAKAEGKRSPNQQKLADHQQLDRTKEQNALIAAETERNAKLIESIDKKAADNLRKINENLVKDRAHNLEETNRLVVAGAERAYQEIADSNQGIVDNENATAAERQAAWERIVKAIGNRDAILRYQAGVMHEFELQQINDEYHANVQRISDEIDDEEKKYEALIALNDAYRAKRQALEDKQNQEDADIEKKAAVPVPDKKVYGPFQNLIDGWTRLVQLVKSQGPTLKETLRSIGGVFVTAFDGMANAIGNVVQQWVLYGSTGPAIMRQILAQALASIAAESAVRAIWETALGFGALFFNPAEAAAHFTSAGLFASIAVGSGLAGRAIAGDKFKQQTNSATGGSQQAESQVNRNVDKQGQYYSSNPDAAVAGYTNRPTVRIALSVQSNDSHIVNVVKKNVTNNGPLRNVIIEAQG